METKTFLTPDEKKALISEARQAGKNYVIVDRIMSAAETRDGMNKILDGIKDDWQKDTLWPLNAKGKKMAPSDLCKVEGKAGDLGRAFCTLKSRCAQKANLKFAVKKEETEPVEQVPVEQVEPENVPEVVQPTIFEQVTAAVTTLNKDELALLKAQIEALLAV